jgi:hypothetical protein
MFILQFIDENNCRTEILSIIDILEDKKDNNNDKFKDNENNKEENKSN